MSVDPASELRQKMAEGAMEMMDELDDDVAEALCEFIPHLEALMERLEGMSRVSRLSWLMAMVVGACE